MYLVRFLLIYSLLSHFENFLSVFLLEMLAIYFQLFSMGVFNHIHIFVFLL